MSFRASAVQAAGALHGWVKNRSDGDVEGIVDGAPVDVEAFLLWCEAGPSFARVTSVERHEDASTDPLPAFCIRP